MAGRDRERQAVDQAAWSDPANWTGSMLGVYFSKRDFRLWVPKRIPAMGWTINLGHPAGPRWLFGIMLVLALLPVLLTLLLMWAGDEQPTSGRVPSQATEFNAF
ncbi:MAG: DUF5808 domain-containing protein [Planctomycetota bacterium]